MSEPGSRLLAILTPMANPTVEAELRQLLPADCQYVVGRLANRIADSLDRLRAYAEDIAASLEQFGGMGLSACGFACTGSGYLLGRAREDALAASISTPILWATHAIVAELTARGARRLAIVSPYPAALHEAGLAYWAAAGFEIVQQSRVETGTTDTRSIYALSAARARPALDAARRSGADAVLLCGTGLPTLPLLRPGDPQPVLSSNYCLAQALLRAAAGEPSE